MKLQIEWLSAYKMYRVWNRDYEEWFDTKGEVLKGIEESEDAIDLYTYGLDDYALKWFADEGVMIKRVGDVVEDTTLSVTDVWKTYSDKIIEYVDAQVETLLRDYWLTLDDIGASKHRAIKSIFYKSFRHFTGIPEDVEFDNDSMTFIETKVQEYLTKGEFDGE